MFKIVEFSHLLIKEYLNKYQNKFLRCLDATCGNGNDTLFILEHLHNGVVDAYDIQQIAIDNTKRLTNDYDNINLIHQSFTNIDPLIYDLVIFNLGYLPNGDKQITTNKDDTLETIKRLTSSFDKLDDPLIIICLYVGHKEGLKESQAIDEYLFSLDSKQYLICKYLNYNRPNAPYILTISKNKLKQTTL